MKKWHTVLWVVFVALALGSGISFWRYKGAHEISVATVNGKEICFAKFRRALGDINTRLNMLRPYAKLYGLSEAALFRNILGMGSPEEVALDSCVRDTLLDQVVNDFDIRIASVVFKEELVKSMPEGLTDDKGYINMDVYQNYLSRLSMTPHEFEEYRLAELKREVIQKSINNAYYLPKFAVREAYEAKNIKKRFFILYLPFSRFLKESEQIVIDDKALKQHYEQQKESYRIPEKRKVRYWTATPEDYEQKVVVEDEAIKHFYERNKSSLFRISPKIKVQHILFSVENGKAANVIQEKANKVLKEIKTSPTKFTEFAQKYSDSATAKSGGVIDFFGRGTHDKLFEDAAFKLNVPGEISQVVRTKRGFEIIQLVERKKAEEKPLEIVRDEIIKTLRIKKAVASLRADLETMMHNARTDVSMLDAFVKKNLLEEKASEWLTQKDGAHDNLNGMLAQKVFASIKKQQQCGYFMHEKKYVVFLLAETQKSIIPGIDEVKESVISDYKKQQAENNSNKLILQIKADVLNKKNTLDRIAEKYDLKIVKTDMVSPVDKEIEGIKNSGQLVNKLFVLSDQSQILQYSNDHDCYLAQLIDKESVVSDDFEKEKDKIAQNKKTSEKTMLSGTFIASLQRIATIEVDKKVLTKTAAMRD